MTFPNHSGVAVGQFYRGKSGFIRYVYVIVDGNAFWASDSWIGRCHCSHLRQWGTVVIDPPEAKAVERVLKHFKISYDHRAFR